VITTARDSSVIEPDIVLDATDFDAVDRAVAVAGDLDGNVSARVEPASTRW
jgi:hypothetical protein